MLYTLFIAVTYIAKYCNIFHFSMGSMTKYGKECKYTILTN